MCSVGAGIIALSCIIFGYVVIYKTYKCLFVCDKLHFCCIIVANEDVLSTFSMLLTGIAGVYSRKKLYWCKSCLPSFFLNIMSWFIKFHQSLNTEILEFCFAGQWFSSSSYAKDVCCVPSAGVHFLSTLECKFLESVHIFLLSSSVYKFW